MGSYLNPSPLNFQFDSGSKIYVDKSELIIHTNEAVNTQDRFICVSRPRRFGKSMALNMLSAYYNCGQDTHYLFDNLKIHAAESYESRINSFYVIRINMQELAGASGDIDEFLSVLQEELLNEINEEFHTGKTRLLFALKKAFSDTGRQFVVLIDEWDCLFREYKDDTVSQKKYLDFLRMLLKDQEYVALAYMTGILPVKKYGTNSALNMFCEYSMTSPCEFAPYFGFTEDEVESLCNEHGMSFEEMRSWYDGYELINYVAWNKPVIYSMYNPRSVVQSINNHRFDSYWNKTETYEALKIYIQLNIEGLKDDIISMLAGGTVNINTGTYTNGMTDFIVKDDVLSLLVHLGYLSYHDIEKTVSIPNKEVSQEYCNAISTMDWKEVAQALQNSKELLNALISGDEKAVASGIERAHEEISILQYNDENSLSCCIHLAFYYAMEYYNIIRELPTGKGFADIAFIPRKLYADKPAIIVELKYDKSAEGAIAQIKQKHYCNALSDYRGNLLLCGINYDKETKTHSCVIEQSEWE